jgi:flavin reductase (DIM6/NTAB) family NADH-FMN oxidoreductase RutF
MKIAQTPCPAVYPSLVSLISCRENITTVSWITPVCYRPPMLCVSIQQQSFSNELIKTFKEFVVNIPGNKILKKVDFCGNFSGKNFEKFKETKLTKMKAKRVDSPIIKECPINLECELEKVIPLGDHDLFIGRVVCTWVDEDVFEGGSINYKKIQPICYTGRKYWSLGSIEGERGISKM